MINKVSFYIPCFNAAKTIGQCLEAVFKQKYPIAEVIVVDDGSTDESSKIISRYPVRLLSHASNQGLAAARNTAIKNAKGDFIACVDADCCPNPDWLSILMQEFNGQRIAAAGGRLAEDSPETIFDEWRLLRMKQHWGESNAAPDFLFGSNAVFRRDSLLKAGLYDEKYHSNYEDVDICNKLREKGYSFVYEPKAIVYHLRKDDIRSLLNTYWKWNFEYYRKEEYYANPDSFAYKIKDNVGLANRYLEEDVASGNYFFLYIDFLLFFHHSLKDYEYFTLPYHPVKPANYSNTAFCLWLSLLDLTFFCYFDKTKNSLSTLIREEDSQAQNFIALCLVIGRLIRNSFKSDEFLETFYRHLFFSFYGLENKFLLDSLLKLLESDSDWAELISKDQVNLSGVFLENLESGFRVWLDGLISRHCGIIQILKVSAEEVDMALTHKKKEDSKNDGK